MRILPPAGSGITSLNIAGTNLIMDEDGTIDLHPRYVLNMLSQGWVVPTDEILIGGGADFPAAGACPGLMMFHLGLNKPLFRNAANTGWVDATGGAVVP